MTEDGIEDLRLAGVGTQSSEKSRKNDVVALVPLEAVPEVKSEGDI